MTESNLTDGLQPDEPYSYRTSPDQSLSEAVIRSVAAFSGQRLIAPSGGDGTDDRGVLPPLFESIDPDALDALFRGTEATDRPIGTVKFTYNGFVVTVDSTGLITLTEQ